jgi:D-arginine dehydrogenase
VTEAADVVIIGAGFAGAATAYHLTARGVRDVLLLESEPRAGVHASGKNAALTFQRLDDVDEARLAIEGTRIYAAPPSDLATRPLLASHGSLLLSADMDTLTRALEQADALGLSASIISRDDAIRRVPALADAPFAAALDHPDDGVVDIARLLDGYLAAASARGARVRFGERVTAVGVRDGKIESVTTGSGAVSTRRVVNAAGPWAGDIARLAGAASFPILPLRRHIYQLSVGVPIDPAWPFVWHAEIDVYFRPEKGGVLASACDATPHPAHPPLVDAAADAELRDKLGRAFPRLAPLSALEPRACLRTFASDERFVIGADADVEGFFWVSALGGHGMSTSYAVGRLAAAAIAGETSAQLARFAPSRLRP